MFINILGGGGTSSLKWFSESALDLDLVAECGPLPEAHSVYHSSNESCSFNRPCTLIRSSIFVANNAVTFSLFDSKDPLLSYEVRGRGFLTASKVCNKYTISLNDALCQHLHCRRRQLSTRQRRRRDRLTVTLARAPVHVILLRPSDSML
jgi:hypothetical protein